MPKLTEDQIAEIKARYEAAFDDDLQARLRSAGVYLAFSFDVAEAVDLYDLTEAEAHSVCEVAARKSGFDLEILYGGLEGGMDRLGIEAVALKDDEDDLTD